MQREVTKSGGQVETGGGAVEDQRGGCAVELAVFANGVEGMDPLVQAVLCRPQAFYVGHRVTQSRSALSASIPTEKDKRAHLVCELQRPRLAPAVPPAYIGRNVQLCTHGIQLPSPSRPRMTRT